MSYKGSYIWRIRQKIGHDELITATVDVVAVKNEKICLIYSKVFDVWSLPGGHVEIEDSWQSAIKTEMREEAGLVARESDLTPFASISGPGYRYHYPNGDKTSPFTLVFLCEKFSEQDLSDSEEVLKKEWFTLSDAKKLDLSINASLILDAYTKYKKTGVFQQIVLKNRSPENS